MEVRIYRYWVGVGGECVPPNKWVEGDWSLTTRLQSTRRGASARWEAGEEVVKSGALNDAPFEPVLRARVSAFVWAPPGALADESSASSWEVVQLGSGLLNWRARVEGPLPDPVKPLIAAAYAAANWEVAEGQGHLEWVPWPNSERPPIPYKSWDRVLNHWICGGEFSPRRAVKGYLVGLMRASQECVILSEDHAPAWPDEGYYVYRHPIPNGRGVD